jgi:predicted metal-dependent peptidase
MSSVYALTPKPVPETKTSFITPGLVMGYNPDFMSELTDLEGGFVLLHEVLHDRLRFFPMLEVLGEDMCDILNDAQDLVINQMLKKMGYPVFSWALMPEKYNFPPDLTTPEYVDLLTKKSKGGGGSGSDGKKKEKGVGGGHCRAPKELQKLLDSELGRSESEIRAVERRTAYEVKKHVEKQGGRGNVPGWMEEWAKIVLDTPVTINWRDILDRVVLDVTGQVIMGGDDFSMRHPSKRSHVRRLIRPGLIDHEIVIAFALDTSASMNVKMMMAGIQHTVSILRSLGIEQAWYMEADTTLALAPQLVDLSYFDSDIKFHGRGGTDFRPVFDAVQRLHPKPDVLFYWTDGDGSAPNFAPPNIETIWGLVPGRYSNRKPAHWGHLVILDEDPNKQRFFENAPASYDEDEDDEDD